MNDFPEDTPEGLQYIVAHDVSLRAQTCGGHKMFLNKIRNIFVSRTQNLCPQQMLRARANGETFMSATMCPQQCVLVCQYLKAVIAVSTACLFLQSLCAR